jgi:hypothetical protein
MKYQRASNKGAMYNYRLQFADIKYKPKIFLHKYSTGIIKSRKINFINLNYRVLDQYQHQQLQIKNFLILTFKIWRNYNDFKIILECYKWLHRIIWIVFTKITNNINLCKSCGSYFCLMIDLVKEVLEDRICTNYKKVLVFLQKEKPVLM